MLHLVFAVCFFKRLPYLRDTRRSIGLDGFRLMHANETAPRPGAAAVRSSVVTEFRRNLATSRC